MKAVLLEKHGGPESLHYGNFPTPDPKPNEVLVRLHAAALNRADLWTRNGWPGLKLEYPHILGCDGAGEVATLGTNVMDFQVGDHVVINSNLGCGECDFCLAGQDNLCRNWHLLGETIRGTYAEYITIPARQLFRIPEGYDYHAAAAAGLVFLTAWHSLIKRGNLRAGESVLVVGASGGVNTASIQIAKYAGAQVLVVGSDAKKLSLAESLGADVLIDRSQEEDWSKAVYKTTSRNGVDVVVDNVGTTFPLSLRTLRKGGRILDVGNTGGPKFEIDNRYIFAKHISIIGSTMGTLKDFSEVMSLVVAGKFKPVVDQTFPLKEARAAHERLESGQQLGKITLQID
jgi:NADPH:quinone reductase-like Zn-dependent oxidoreductase